MKELNKILNTENYTLLYFEPDIILYGFLDGNLCVYQDVAEEFARGFFFEDTTSKKYRYEKDLMRAKHWLVGILYHLRQNSMPDIMNLTAYRSCGSLYDIIKKFGPLRNFKKSTELAFQKKYGNSMSEYMSDRMKNIWEIRNGPFRDKISKAASVEMKNLWTKDREHILKRSVGTIKKLYEERFKHRIPLELKEILEKKKVSSYDLGDVVKVSPNTIQKDLKRLEKEELIKKIKESRGGSKPVYEVTKKGLEFLSQTN